VKFNCLYTTQEIPWRISWQKCRTKPNLCDYHHSGDRDFSTNIWCMWQFL